MQAKIYVKYIMISIMLLLLSSCGFTLRGNTDLAFKTIYVDLPADSALGNELKRHLHHTKAQLVNSVNDADAVVQILSESRDKNVFSLNSQGRVREYTLVYSIEFRVKNKQHKNLIAPTKITLQRFLNYDDTQVLAKENEESFLYRDMQSDIVQQILRQLTTLAPQP